MVSEAAEAASKRRAPEALQLDQVVPPFEVLMISAGPEPEEQQKKPRPW